MFLPIALTTLGVALVTPGLTRRRAIASAGARTFLATAGLRLRVSGLQHLPPGPCVIVANHASYLDGVVMQAALPPRFAFVIKKEMVSVPLASLLLRRIGSEFVERGDARRSAADARRVLRTAATGQALGFFPEGTFTPQPGLARFHAGAFVTAARARLPVVPAVIRGTRAILPAEQAFPWPGPIEVELLPALADELALGTNGAARLRAAARAAILARLDEPDLAPGDDAGRAD